MSAVDALPDKAVDCLVVGAGPAGLTAATYLARYRRDVCVIDAGDSRAARIPRSRNVPGFPDGISGPRLLERMRLQSEAMGVVVTRAKLTELVRDQDRFVARTDGQTVSAQRVLMATGCSDKEPLPGLTRGATWRGQVRWCPVCDAYEAIDKRVVLIAEPVHATSHALFLRTFTRHLMVVMAPGEPDLPQEQCLSLDAAGITVIRETLRRVHLRRGQPGTLQVDGGRRYEFDVVYPMTGGKPHVGLAALLGAAQAADGRLQVDIRQQTSIRGLYAAGDVVASLGQVAVAVAEGAVAATAIHHSLPYNFR